MENRTALKYTNLTTLYIVLGLCCDETGLVQPGSRTPQSQKEHFRIL